MLHIAARAGHAGIVQTILAHREKAIADLRGEEKSGEDDAADDRNRNHDGGEEHSDGGGGDDEKRKGGSGGGGGEDEDAKNDAASDDGREPELEDDPVEARDHTESMPLHWAADGGHLAAVEMIVEAGAAINMGGMWRGSTAAHLSARNGHAAVVRYLHSKGANMNAQDMWNYATPLILAAEGGHPEVIQFLLDRRVRIGVEDKFGTTAAQNARTAECRHLIRSTQIVRNTVLAMHGATRTDVFLGWRDILLDGKAERARDAKGTWQMVFALYGEDTTAMYYWLWRQWEMRERRQRRALTDEVNVLVDAMTGNPGFVGISHKRVAELAETMVEVEYEAGQSIVCEGEPGDAFFIVVDGQVDVLMTVEDDEGQTSEAKVASLGAGKAFGEVSLRFECPRTATVRATTDCELRKLGRENFLEALAAEREEMEEAAAAGGSEDRPRTMLDPDALRDFANLARPLEHWEREMLATLFTVERYDPGSPLPVPTADGDGAGDDGYLGLVLSGTIKTARRDLTSAVPAVQTDFFGPGEHYAATAVVHEDGGGTVVRSGAATCLVPPDAEKPAVVALLQGMDIKELPRALQELLMAASLPRTWTPPPRRMAHSSASAAAHGKSAELAEVSNAARASVQKAEEAESRRAAATTAAYGAEILECFNLLDEVGRVHVDSP